MRTDSLTETTAATPVLGYPTVCYHFQIDIPLMRPAGSPMFLHPHGEAILISTVKHLRDTKFVPVFKISIWRGISDIGS